jgi:hypothetical protein
MRRGRNEKHEQARASKLTKKYKKIKKFFSSKLSFEITQQHN